MSGPKHTTFQIQRQRQIELERIRLEREKEKNRQSILSLRQKINLYSYLNETQKEKLLNGLKIAEQESQKNNYIKTRKVTDDIEIYLKNIESQKDNYDYQKKINELLEKSLPSEKREMLLREINEISTYDDIKSQAIQQRVDHYSEMLKESINKNMNLSTKEERNIKIFIKKTYKIKSNYDQKKSEELYVKNVLGRIIGAKIDEKRNIINGNIDGTPVNINFNSNAEIIFDISNDNNCVDILNKIKKNLNDQNIDIGNIYVKNTQEIIRVKKDNKINENKDIQR